MGINNGKDCYVRDIRFIYAFVCSFLLAQKRTKKGSRSLAAMLLAPHFMRDCPVLLEKSRLLGMSLTLRRVVILLFPALLGCVIWHPPDKAIKK